MYGIFMSLPLLLASLLPAYGVEQKVSNEANVYKKYDIEPKIPEDVLNAQMKILSTQQMPATNELTQPEFESLIEGIIDFYIEKKTGLEPERILEQMVEEQLEGPKSSGIGSSGIIRIVSIIGSFLTLSIVLTLFCWPRSKQLVAATVSGIQTMKDAPKRSYKEELRLVESDGGAMV